MDFTSIYKCSSFFFNTINKNKTKQNNKNIQNTTNFLKDACQNKTSHELIVIENFQEKKTRTKEYFFGRRRNVTAVGGQSNQEKKKQHKIVFFEEERDRASGSKNAKREVTIWSTCTTVASSTAEV